jgi:hypothetical protein
VKFVCLLISHETRKALQIGYSDRCKHLYILCEHLFSLCALCDDNYNMATALPFAILSDNFKISKHFVERWITKS